MILRALVETWVRFVWKAEGGVTYEVAADRRVFIPSKALNTQTIFMRAGDGIEFSNEAAGEYPYHMMAADHPEVFRVEDEDEVLH